MGNRRVSNPWSRTLNGMQCVEVHLGRGIKWDKNDVRG